MLDYVTICTNKNGYTALMMACERGHTTTAQALLEAGAGLNLQDTVVSDASLMHEK
jgi:ankyrin repeat protein